MICANAIVWIYCLSCNSCQEIKNIADYVSPVKGGEGAVRDIIEHFLNEAGIWEKLITEIYDVGR